jgi:hypothetical protein
MTPLVTLATADGPHRPLCWADAYLSVFDLPAHLAHVSLPHLIAFNAPRVGRARPFPGRGAACSAAQCCAAEPGS